MQTWALLRDSYHLVMSRKLFWISLIITGVVILVYGSIGFDEQGWSILFGLAHFDDDLIRAGGPFQETMYLWIFSFFLVGFWLTWAATILALISTSPIFNDFMSEGSVDLVLSKPISRQWIFIVKYLGALLFVLLQVTLFCLGAFVCIGLRVGNWNWAVFSAVPLVVVFFSYLYCVNVLFSMLTRSTLASLLLTVLFWFLLWVVQSVEAWLNDTRLDSAVRAEAAYLSPDVRERAAARAENFGVWQRRAAGVLTVLPKTQQTLGLMDRWISDNLGSKSMQMLLRGPQDNPDFQRERDEEIASLQRLEAEYATRSAWFVIGSSLAFEAVVLALACWLFVRRDF